MESLKLTQKWFLKVYAIRIEFGFINGSIIRIIYWAEDFDFEILEQILVGIRGTLILWDFEIWVPQA